MRKFATGSLLALAAAMMAVPVSAGDSDGKFNLTGEIRTRWDYSANVFDADDDGDSGSAVGGNVDDDFDFFPYRVRLAANGEFSDNVYAKIEMQGYGFFGNDGPAPTLTHVIGQGFGTGDNESEIDLYQGFVHLEEVSGSSWSLRIGRQEYTFANELLFGDNDFYNGQAFDGIRAMADFDSWDLDLFYFMIDEDSGAITDPDFDTQDEAWGATGQFEIGSNGQELNPYVFFSRNTDSGLSRARVYTYGAQYGRDRNEDENLDWNAELAMQSGDVGSGALEEDVSSYLFEGWFGYSFGDDNQHRAHVGYLEASGDDDAGDGDMEAFISLFGDNHAHNRLGDLDLFGGPSVAGSGGFSNVTDISLGYSWTGDRRSLRVSLHNLALTEDVGGDDEIGNELNVAYDYSYSKNVAFQVGIAHLSAGDYLDSAWNGADDADDVQRAWWQVQLAW
jgi:hypothetical protein